ncbi:DNA-binding protein [Zoogloea sp. LCSB751]|uniref:DNA-binding protein n=1 Tax=Zoogloea sp. LCSB751 TaxID=1965277 RepID=UPI0009A4E0B9|nr:DNA-binding protein [Zoogloea sp. LCSB751]
MTARNLQGENPTYLKVHERLGKGATRIVSAYIREWRERQALGATLNRHPLFGNWPEALQLKAKSLFDALLALSAEGAAAAEEALKVQFGQRTAELQQITDEARQECADAQDRLRNERAETARLITELEALREAELAREAMITDLLAQRDQHVAQIAESQRQAQNLRDEHRLHVMELHVQAAAERNRLVDELRIERERAAGEREHLMRQTDQLRQDHAAAVQELRQRATVLESSLVVQRKKTEESEVRGDGLAAQVRELESGVLTRDRSIADLRTEIATQHSRLLELTGTSGGQAARIEILEQHLQRETARSTSAEARIQELLVQRIATPTNVPTASDKQA